MSTICGKEIGLVKSKELGFSSGADLVDESVGLI